MLLLALALACDPAAPDTDTQDTAGTDTDTGTLGPIALDFVDATFAAPPARYGLATDGAVLYALRADGLALNVSEDLGRTWHFEGDVPGMLVYGAGKVYSLGATGVVRVLDGGTRTEPVGLPDGVAPSDLRALQVDGEGTLWATRNDGAVTMWWSADDGASWSSAPLPGETTWVFTCRVAAGPLVLVREDTDVLRWNGEGFDVVGAASEVNDCFVSDQGSIFVEAGLIPEQLRLPAGSSAWETSPLPGYVVYQQVGQRVARVQNNSVVETSTDDGATFAPLTAARPGHTVHTLVALGDDLVALDAATPGGQGVARLRADTTQWDEVAIAGLPLYPRVRELAFADDGRMAMLYLDDQRVAVYAQDAAGVWYRGLDFTQAEAVALAISPDGERLAVGGAEGRVQLLGDVGTTPLWSGRMTTAGGFTEPDPITSLAWVRTAGEPVLLAATANEQDSAGNLWRGVDASDHLDWDVRTPVSSTASITLRPGGYHGLGAVNSGGHVTASAQLRSWYTTNGWMASVLGGDVLTTQQGWWEETSVWPSALLSTTISPVDHSYVRLWPEASLQLNQPGFPPRQVQVTLPRDGVERARFDAEGRLWVVGNGLLVHTPEPVVGGR